MNARFQTYSTEHQAQALDAVTRYRRKCNENYLSSFTENFHDICLGHCKSAFVQIPLGSTFLILGIVAALHWAPFHKKSLKKPGFVFAFLFSVILVSINIGQIVSIIIPLINPNATPDRILKSDKRESCGYAAEIVALSLILGSSVLSALIAAFVIRLYAIRVRHQDIHINDLNMATGRDEETHCVVKSSVKPMVKPNGKKGKIPMAGQTSNGWSHHKEEEENEKGW